MRRGQFVVVATSGDYGKPRPALVVQSELFAELPSVVICPLTTALRNDADQFRLEVDPKRPRPEQGAYQETCISPFVRSGDRRIQGEGTRLAIQD